MGIAEVLNGIVASWYGVLEWSGHGVQLAAQNTHAPDEVLHPCNGLLVWFCCQDDHGSPRAGALCDPSVVDEILDVTHDDWFFVNTVAGAATTDRRRTASVDGELEAEDRFGSAGLIKTVPVLLNEGFQPGSDGWAGGCADMEVGRELCVVPVLVPKMDVVSVQGVLVVWLVFDGSTEGRK